MQKVGYGMERARVKVVKRKKGESKGERKGKGVVLKPANTTKAVGLLPIRKDCPVFNAEHRHTCRLDHNS